VGEKRREEGGGRGGSTIAEDFSRHFAPSVTASSLIGILRVCHHADAKFRQKGGKKKKAKGEKGKKGNAEGKRSHLIVWTLLTTPAAITVRRRIKRRPQKERGGQPREGKRGKRKKLHLSLELLDYPHRNRPSRAAHRTKLAVEVQGENQKEEKERVPSMPMLRIGNGRVTPNTVQKGFSYKKRRKRPYHSRKSGERRRRGEETAENRADIVL